MPEAFFSLGAKIMHTPAVLGIYKYLYINIGIIMGSSFRGLELENMCIPKVAYHRQPDKSRKKKKKKKNAAAEKPTQKSQPYRRVVCRVAVAHVIWRNLLTLH